MKTIYLIFKEMSREIGFYIVVILELLFMMTFGTMAMTEIGSFDRENFDYLPAFEDAYLIYGSNATNYIGDENLLATQVGYSFNTEMGNTTVQVINPLLSTILTVDVIGQWFSDYDESSANKQAILPHEYQSSHKIGDVYNIGTEIEPYEIEVIGFMEEGNVGINLNGGFNSSFVEYMGVMVLDDILPVEPCFYMYVISDLPPSYYEINYGFRVSNAMDAYSNDRENERDDRVFKTYLTLLIMLIFTVTICAYSVFKSKSSSRKNAIKYLVGETKSRLVFKEVVKAVIIFVIPFFISLLTLINSNGEFSVSTFGILSGIVFAIYSVASMVSIIATCKSKPLVSLKRQ